MRRLINRLAGWLWRRTLRSGARTRLEIGRCPAERSVVLALFGLQLEIPPAMARQLAASMVRAAELVEYGALTPSEN